MKALALRLDVLALRGKARDLVTATLKPASAAVVNCSDFERQSVGVETWADRSIDGRTGDWMITFQWEDLCCRC
jgi:hypothetical protein